MLSFILALISSQALPLYRINASCLLLRENSFDDLTTKVWSFSWYFTRNTMSRLSRSLPSLAFLGKSEAGHNETLDGEKGERKREGKRGGKEEARERRGEEIENPLDIIRAQEFLNIYFERSLAAKQINYTAQRTTKIKEFIANQRCTDINTQRG